MTQLILVSAICALALAAAIVPITVLCMLSASPLGAVVAVALTGALLGVISIWSSVKGSTLLSVAPLVVFAAILSVYFGQQIIAFGGVALVLGAIVFTRSFGDAELRMLAPRTSHLGESLLSRSNLGGADSRQRAVQLQGNRCWDTLVARLEVICNAKSPSRNDTLQLLLDRASELSEQIKQLIGTNECCSQIGVSHTVTTLVDSSLSFKRSPAARNIVGSVNFGIRAHAEVKD